MIIVALAYFGSGIASTFGSLWLWHKIEKKNDDSDKHYDALPTTIVNKHNLSSRGIETGKSSPLPYLGAFLKSLSNPCHPITNKDGYVTLCVAENKLILPELSSRLINGRAGNSSTYTAEIAFGNQDNFCYNDNLGMKHVREKVARFLSRKFINPGNLDDAVLQAKAEQIVLGAGACAIMNFLFRFIAEENEVVLIPAPYYAAFEYDMGIIAKCVPYPVHMNDPAKGPQPQELENVYQSVTKEGRKVRILLLTNPNNPLGTIYSPTVIKNCISWARSKNMHSIVDEIYGLSVHDVSEYCSFTQIKLNGKVKHSQTCCIIYLMISEVQQ